MQEEEGLRDWSRSQFFGPGHSSCFRPCPVLSQAHRMSARRGIAPAKEPRRLDKVEGIEAGEGQLGQIFDQIKSDRLVQAETLRS